MQTVAFSDLHTRRSGRRLERSILADHHPTLERPGRLGSKSVVDAVGIVHGEVAARGTPQGELKHPDRLAVTELVKPVQVAVAVRQHQIRRYITWPLPKGLHGWTERA